MQPIYDALKRCHLEGSAWFTWKGERILIRHIDWSTEDPVLSRTFTAIVRSRRKGGINIAECNPKEGLRIREEKGPLRYIQWVDLLAVVEERHPIVKNNG